VDVPPALVCGEADEGYGSVADAFRRNFAERGEIGAACAVFRDGRKVVDLWGAYRDGRTRAPWREDTVMVMFSTTKGVCSPGARPGAFAGPAGPRRPGRGVLARVRLAGQG